MSFKDRLTVERITTAEQREEALNVLESVYKDEKRWVEDREKMLPVEDLGHEGVSWFAACLDGEVVGVTRVLYEIPLELYKEYGFELSVKGLDVEKFVAENNIAEVGRFAVYPKYRRRFHIAAILMRASGLEALERGFTHFITDVFEDDPNTPHGFHQRVLGFQEVASHMTGELKCESRRVTMLLDLHEAKDRLTGKKGWFFRYLTDQVRKNVDVSEVPSSGATT